MREYCAAGLDAPRPVTFETPDLRVVAEGDLAVSWGIDRVVVPRPDGPQETRSRATRVFRRHGDAWRMIHQHRSQPAAASAAPRNDAHS